MISARLQGGLGNQLFQISAAQSLAWDNDDVAIFNFESCYTPLQGNKATKYSDTIFRNITQGEPDVDFFWKEPSHEFCVIPYRKNLLLDGYFQSLDYFRNNLIRIRDLFVTTDLTSECGIYTGIHVRRGDYLRFPNVFHQCDLDYYRRAMDVIGGEFIVVSDDINWCRENLAGDNIQYSEFKDDVLDLSLLASCKNIIGSNSTFALWGYYLNRNKDCIGIFPEKWFGSEGPSSRTIYPDNVIKL